MAWDKYIPYKGDKRTTKRIRELEHEAGTLPVLFALFLNEALKIQILQLNIGVYEPLKFFTAAFLCAFVYVYDKEVKAASEKAKEKAEETKDKAKDKVQANRQSKLDEYGEE